MKSKTEKLRYASNNIQMTLTLTSFPTLENDNEGCDLYRNIASQLGFHLHAEREAGLHERKMVCYLPSPQRE